MRTLVPAFALLMGGAAWWARGREAEEPQRRMPTRATAAPEAVVVEIPAESPESRPAISEPVQGPRPARETPLSVPAEPRLSARLEARLRGELLLSDGQRDRVALILEERGRDVAAYEAEVRRRGWHRLDDFTYRVGQIRERAHDRIAALLDEEQGAIFAELRPRLHESDFICIEVPESEVLSLD